MDPDNLMTAISTQMEATLAAMAAAQTVEEKKEYSEIVRNLAESLGVFLKMASDIMGMDLDDFDDDDDDMPF